MADKTSFVLYTDYLDDIEDLTIEQRGILLTLLLRYTNGIAVDQIEDLAVSQTFRHWRRTIDRDAAAWEAKRARRAEAGRTGGLAKSSNAKQNLANLAVTVTDTVTDTDNKAQPKKHGVLQEFAGDDMALRDALYEFNRMRQLKNKPLTDAAKVRLAEKLTALFGSDHAAMITALMESVDNGWTDVYDHRNRMATTTATAATAAQGFVPGTAELHSYAAMEEYLRSMENA